MESEDETDGEVEEIPEERDRDKVKQNERPIEREAFFGGDSCIHTQQGEEKDEVENYETYAPQNDTANNNVFGSQRSVVTNVDENLNCSVNTLQIERGYIRHCIGQEL